MTGTGFLARIEFEKAGERATAELGLDRVWRCREMPAIADALTIKFNPWRSGPADGVVGAKEAHAAAEWLKGQLTFPKTDDAPLPENACY